ncbi:MAG TPA: biotin--[acetyl-CoA-carboxylase] ligase [Bacteroidia bacterium]|nr:biotin--[acetyl-CoA-carboxylase] ligase [Bacteroidia bacterium]HRH07455.1 biotin--[acetyl-CoA-carboxylase] ligase [Bacteroidia bacterium]HRH63276.1 biotin--[acetyl-CoA-carboxylase] ligase [Bacteroidia bacterium]
MPALFIGTHLIKLTSIDSTNTYLQQQLKQQNVLEGTVAIANEQLSGKGQRGNIWQSEPSKNLTFSLLLRPKHLKAEKQFILSKIISLGVLDFVRSHIKHKKEVKVKWPNDIYVKNKKIAGILIENSLRGEEVNTSIIGIGLNINQLDFTPLSATSLALETGIELNLDKALGDLCCCIEVRYLQYINQNLATLHGDYHQHLYCLNELHWFESKNRQYQGIIVGITGEGKLLLESFPEKIINEYGVKEIKFLK